MKLKKLRKTPDAQRDQNNILKLTQPPVNGRTKAEITTVKFKDCPLNVPEDVAKAKIWSCQLTSLA